MIYDILILALVFILSILVSGNNISAAVGTIIGSRIVSRGFGLIIGAVGFSTGLITEGRFLSGSIFRVMPNDQRLVFLALITSAAVFAFATYTRIPLSLTMALVGSALGIALKTGFNYNHSYITLLILTWVAAPFISFLASALVNRGVVNLNVSNVWRSAVIYKVLLVIISFFTAFTLGANTFGLLLSMSPGNYTMIVMVAGIFIGAVVLSSGIIRRVSQEMYGMRYASALVSLAISSFLVEGATLFAIPLSNTQTLTSSVLGSGYSYRTKVVFLKPFLIVASMWVISPLIGMFITYTLA